MGAAMGSAFEGCKNPQPSEQQEDLGQPATDKPSAKEEALPEAADANAATAEAQSEQKAAADEVEAGDGVPASTTFTITCIGVRGLRKAEWMPEGKSNCFCLVKPVNRDVQLCRTDPLKDALEPIWQVDANLADLVAGESLEFSVWEADSDGSENCLGKATLDNQAFGIAGFNGELKLDETGEGISATLRVKVKMADQECPPPVPQAEVTISVARNPKKKKLIGLDLDISDGNYLYVTDVKAGPFHDYNQNSKPSEQLKPGDFIIQVNGFTGTAKQLYDKVQKEESWNLVVRRPDEVRVAIDKKETKKSLGLVFKKPSGNALLISEVGEGPFQEWNNTNAGKEVRIGDRIVAVGSYRGKATALQKNMATACKFQATVVRPACPKESWWFL